MNEYLREYSFLNEKLPSAKVCQSSEPLYGHGSTVWDAALVLCAFLESEKGLELVRGRSCIELGAGTGIVSISASLLGAMEAIATDKQICVPFIRQNIGLNEKAAETCGAETLDWDKIEQAESFSGKFDWVLCADCVYDPDHVENLIRTIMSLKPRKGIIVSNERRESNSNAVAEKKFIGSMYEAGFCGKAVHRDLIRPDWRCDDIDVVVFERPLPSDKRGA
jgi:predicted nicotinamide N-methyase